MNVIILGIYGETSNHSDITLTSQWHHSDITVTSLQSWDKANDAITLPPYLFLHSSKIGVDRFEVITEDPGPVNRVLEVSQRQRVGAENRQRTEK